MSDFDIEGARKAGYGDTEIADHLAKTNNFDASAARKSGYSDADIIGHLSSPVAGTARPNAVGAPMAVDTKGVPSHGLTDDIVSAIKGTGAFVGDMARNAPGDAYEVGKGVVNALAHPVDTAKNIGALASGLTSKAMRPTDAAVNYVHRQFDPEGADVAQQGREINRSAVEAPADAVGQMYADSYGTPGNALNTLRTRPVSAMLDASTLLGGAGGLLTQAGASGGRVGTVINAAGKVVASAPGAVDAVGRGLSAAGRALDPITQTGNAVAGAAKIAEPIITNALGVTTGAGKDAVRLAAGAGREGGTAGETFRDNMRGNVPISDIVDKAKEAVGELRRDRADAYKKGMGEVGKDATVLDFEPIDAAVAKANQVGSYKGVTINRSAGDTVGKINDVIGEWKSLDPKEYHTPEGLDALKRTIGDLRDSTDFGTPARVAADRVYNAVKDEVAKQAPAYSKTMEEYAKASKQLDEATRTFSLGEKATGDTAARKLLAATRNNVQTNYGERGRLLNALAEKAPDLPYAIAGQAMNSPVPRGLVGRAMLPLEALSVTHNPLALPMMAASSPRLVGETAHLAGRAAGLVDSGMNALHVNPSSVRNAGRAAYQTEQLGAPDNVGSMALAYRKALERRNALAR